MWNIGNKSKQDVTIRDVYVVTCNEENEILYGDIIIKDGRIERIACKNPPSMQLKARIAVPAFHNLHMHLGETIFRGYCDGMDLFQYLDVSHDSYEKEVWKKNESRVHRLSGLISFMESVRNGCGIFACSRGTLEAEEIGIKSWCLFPIVNISKLKDYYDDSRGLQKLEEKEQNDRIRTSIFVQSLYLADETKIDEVAIAMRNNSRLKLFIHVAETQREMEYVDEKYHCSPIEFLHRKGLLGERTFCVHCVHLSDNDIRLLKESRTNVVLCPVSNLKLRSGFPDIKRLKESGISLMVSPDGFATNNSASLLEELKLLGLMSGGCFSETELLRLLTVNPAQALCEKAEQHRSGRLIPEGKADIAIFETSGYLCTDRSTIMSHLIYNYTAFDCRALYIDGDEVYGDGAFKTINEEEVIREFIKLQQEVFYEQG